MSVGQLIAFNILSTLFISIEVYVVYSASKINKKSFYYFLTHNNRKERSSLLTRNENLMEYFALGIGVAGLIIVLW